MALEGLLYRDPIEVMRQIANGGKQPVDVPENGNLATMQNARSAPLVGGGVGAPAMPQAQPPMPQGIYAGPGPAAAPAAMAPTRMAMPTAPVDDPRRGEIQTQRERDAAPLDANDPKYKSSIWRKLLALTAAGLQGYGGGRNGMEIGQAASRSGRYYSDEESRKTRLASDDQQLESMDRDFGRREKQYESGMRGFEAQSRNDERTQTAADRKADRDADNQRLDNDPLPGMAPRVERDTLTGKKKYFYKTRGGKEMEGNEPTKDANLAETIRHDKAQEAIERERITAGSKPRRGTPQEFANADNEKNKLLKAARSQYDKTVANAKAINPNDSGSVEKANRARQMEEIEAELNYKSNVEALGGEYSPAKFGGASGGYDWDQEAQAAYQAKIGRSGGAPAHPPPAAAPAAAPKPAAAGDFVRVQKPNGEVVRVPRANLQRALDLGGKAL